MTAHREHSSVDRLLLQITCHPSAEHVILAEYERLSAAGVQFTRPPTVMGPVILAVLDDTCGNLVQLIQHNSTT